MEVAKGPKNVAPMGGGAPLGGAPPALKVGGGMVRSKGGPATREEGGGGSGNGDCTKDEGAAAEKFVADVVVVNGD